MSRFLMRMRPTCCPHALHVAVRTSITHTSALLYWGMWVEHQFSKNYRIPDEFECNIGRFFVRSKFIFDFGQKHVYLLRTSIENQWVMFLRRRAKVWGLWQWAEGYPPPLGVYSSTLKGRFPQISPISERARVKYSTKIRRTLRL